MLSNDASLDRDKVIARAMRMFAGGSDQLASMVFRRLSFENLNVTEGEFAASPFASLQSKDGVELRFQIKAGDALVRVSQQSAYWYFQLRKRDGQWTVVAEYVV